MTYFTFLDIAGTFSATPKMEEAVTDRTGITTAVVYVDVEETGNGVDVGRLKISGAPSTGLRLPCVSVGRQWDKGIARYYYVYEGMLEGARDENPVFEFRGYMVEAPIQAHPNFKALDNEYHWDYMRERFQLWVEDEKGRMKLSDLAGVDAFYTCAGEAKYRYASRDGKTREGKNPFDNVGGIVNGGGVFLGTVSSAAQKASGGEKRTWLKMMPRVTYRGNVYEIEETYLMSGKEGWKEELYGSAVKQEVEPGDFYSGRPTILESQPSSNWRTFSGDKDKSWILEDATTDRIGITRVVLRRDFPEPSIPLSAASERLTIESAGTWESLQPVSVARRWENGIASYYYTYEGKLEGTIDVVDPEFNGSMIEAPIMGHPNFWQLALEYGWDDIRERFPQFKPKGQATENGLAGRGKTGERSTMWGVEGFYAPAGILTLRRVLGDINSLQSSGVFDNVNDVVNLDESIANDITSGAMLWSNGKRNWLKLMPSISWRGNVWEVVEEYMLSGPKGWNEKIYGGKQ